VDRLAAMEAFVRVVETGSFSLAARQLRLGQPAVSKMVAQLEESIPRPTKPASLPERATHIYCRAPPSPARKQLHRPQPGATSESNRG
jgi:hypothetical protein